MADQTVTRTIESGSTPDLIYSKLSDAFLIPQWAPLFAEEVEHVEGGTFQFTKGSSTFNVDVLLNDSSLTADYLRDIPDGKRAGAYLRVMPKPRGGSVVTMTVPVGPGSTPDQVAAVLDQELEALIKLTQ